MQNHLIVKVNQPVPVLEGGTGIYPQFMFDMIQSCKEYEAFNQSELRLISDAIKMQNEALNEVKQLLRQQREVLWQASDKSNPDTEDDFRDLNKTKDLLRYIKKKQKKISSIHTKIKQMQKAT